MLLAIDIGGTKVAAAWISDGVLIERRQLAMAYDAAGFEQLIDTITRGWPAPRHVAVCTTGYVDAGRVYSVNFDIIKFWDGFALKHLVQQRFHCPVTLINDGQAAAWGEYVARRKEHPDLGNLLFITLSTGVGGGMVLDHQLRVGPHGLAGHVGHAGVRLPALDGVSRCGCGRSACLELVASGTALARQATALLGRPIDSKQLFELAASDARACVILDNAAQAVAEAISGLHMAMDLQEVVLGGSVGLADGMLARIRASLAGLSLRAAPSLSAARLSGDAGLVGVIALHRQHEEA